MIPDPPLDAHGHLRIGFWSLTVYLARGPVGICVMCQECTWDWLDLTLCDMPPVTDGRGILTDQVPLHPRCVATLLGHWATVMEPDSGDEAAATPDGPATPVAGVRPSSRARTGAYAR